ncbi:MRC1-like domain-containing protein [Lipomyces orientalis]|uniref:MRC1-like domain-containing protein n=1 Tax=Lipomyces orientalis TaxID=1233043 RepID=A0ACC3TZM5_9ASCO
MSGNSPPAASAPTPETPSRPLDTLFLESDADSTTASSPATTPSRRLSRDADNEGMLTPRTRVRRLLGHVDDATEHEEGGGVDGEDAGSASDTSSTDHAVAVPRKKGGLAALLKKRNTEKSEMTDENTAASYQSVRRKMLLQLANGKTPAAPSAKKNSSAVEDVARSASDSDDDDSDKENRQPVPRAATRPSTRPGKSTAIGPFQLDSMFSDDRDEDDSDKDGTAISITPAKKGMPTYGKDLSELEMSDGDNNNTNGPAHSMARKDILDDISSDDDDDDDDVGVDSLRDLLHNKAFTDDVRRKREERLALEAKKRAAEEKRRMREKERIQLEQELEQERLLEEQLANKRKPRKASKKALEEMNKETARMQRNRQLALQPLTAKKISKESLFAKFNFTPSGSMASGVPNSSSSQAAGSDIASTPPSSPLQVSLATKSGAATMLFEPTKKSQEEPNVTTKTGPDSDSDLDSDDSGLNFNSRNGAVADLIASAQDKKNAADQAKCDDKKKKLSRSLTTPGKQDLRVLRAQLPPETVSMIRAAKAKSAGLVQRAIVHLSDNESDSDLEILPPGQANAQEVPKRKVTLENVKAPVRKETPIWRRFTAYKSPSKEFRKRGYLTDRELDEMLQARIREQARKETEEKQAEILAKGGKILTAEEKKKEDQIIEDLLERERKNAEETRKRERRERRRNGELDDDEKFEDDEDDEDDDDEDEYEEEDIAELLSDEAEEDVDDDRDGEEASDDQEDDIVPVEDEPGLTQFFQETQKDGENVKDVHGDNDLLQVKTPPLLQLPPRNPHSSPMFPPSSEPNGSQSMTQVDNNDVDQDGLSANPTRSKAHYSSPELNRHLTGVNEVVESAQPVTSFSKLLKEQRRQDKLQKRLKKSRAMKQMFDEHAEESDDEWKGLGGASDSDGDSADDEHDSDLDAMVNDNVDENADRARVAALFAADELDRDEKLVNEMIKGVHGGFRKRHQGGLYDLSDSDDEAAYAERRRQRREIKRRKHLLKDEKMSLLAENPKAQAFFKTIEEDDRKPAEPQYVDIGDLEGLLNG